MKIRPFRIPAVLAIVAIVSAALVACGSGGSEVAAPQDAPAETVATTIDTNNQTELAVAEDTTVSVPASAPKTVATSAVVLEPADTSDETPAESTEMASVAVEPVEDPVTEEVLQTEIEPEPVEKALLTSYADYGFALKLDLGADVQTAGWTEPEPSMTQGIIAFAYGGVNANLVWGPPQDRTPLTFLADTYNVLRASQPSVTFESISDGDVMVSEQEGVYGGFKAVDTSGAAIGGGLIGAWVCGDSDTAFRMTLTGEDATVVQLRFDRLLENFACASS